MVADIEEVDPDQPDPDKKDPFKSDKESKCAEAEYSQCQPGMLIFFPLRPAQRLYIYKKDTIRFRVTSLQWQEVEPLPPNVRDKPREIDPETGLPKEMSQEEVDAKQAQREQEAGLKIMVSRAGHAAHPFGTIPVLTLELHANRRQ
jgi:hypothetical protein